MSLGMKYVMKKVEINKDSIENFFIYEDERRKIRTGKVASMKVNFKKEDQLEKHFDSPMVVNLVEDLDIWRIIDGNHRYESIAQKILEDPNFSIFVWLAEYKNLDRDEERRIYSKWNKGTPESATDFLKYHFKKIELADTILRRLPVSIYGGEKTMGIKNFVGSYLVAKKSKFTGSYSAGGEKTFRDINAITMDNIIEMRAWYLDHSEIFGEYYKGNPWYMTTPLAVFFRIWMDNKHISPQKYKTLIKSVFAMRINLWLPTMKASGRDASKLFYFAALDALNNARRTIHWKSDTETYAETMVDSMA